MAKDQNARGRYGKGALGCLLGAGLFLIMGLGQAALAQPTQVLILEVFVDAPVVGQLRIVGQDFDNGQDPVVTRGSATNARDRFFCVNSTRISMRENIFPITVIRSAIAALSSCGVESNTSSSRTIV